jgi:dipeptidyl aminopeptidase/acylaminoacyl peptidase
VGDVALSPDGASVAYTVRHFDAPGRPSSSLWIQPLPSGQAVRVGGDADRGRTPVWSRDGRQVAFLGTQGGRAGLYVANADATGVRWPAEVTGSNSPLTHEGPALAWAPDGRRIAFVSTTPGPETEQASGDPIVITRYKYKPDAGEGLTRFNDNRRRHVFVVDVGTAAVTQLTYGDYDEWAIDWSPDAAEIVFVSNRDPDSDRVYNPDIFTVRVADRTLRRVTATEGAEFQPRWSPDGRRIAVLGTRRGVTDLETQMEDTHGWLVAADGSNRRELGAAIDNRQDEARFSSDARFVYCTVEDGVSDALYRMPVDGGAPERVVAEAGRLGAWSQAGTTIAYALSTPADYAQLYVRAADGTARRLTTLNDEVLRDVEVAPVESFRFTSNDFRFEVEALTTKPLGQSTRDRSHPMIVVVHGGPHGRQGPAFDFRAQVYAARGWAVLMVNYRGSTGYGQRFADAVFGDQNGAEAQDVLYGAAAAVRRHPWIDASRLAVEGGSYGGQLTCWLVTQTPMFRSATARAPITNLISYNYMTYYNMYEQMTWGQLPHQGNLMDVLWERSALKHVAKARTPVMLVHGENDNDVPIAESEQFYVALKDVGVETIMVRYPREGHGITEARHVVDWIERSIAWHEKHFAQATR